MPVFTEVLPIDNAAGASFQLPNTEDVKVMAVRVTVDNSGGTDTQPELAMLAPTGAVIATERQSEAIPAGDSGMASWALRLAKKASGAAGGSGIEFTANGVYGPNNEGDALHVKTDVGPTTFDDPALFAVQIHGTDTAMSLAALDVLIDAARNMVLDCHGGFFHVFSAQGDLLLRAINLGGKVVARMNTGGSFEVQDHLGNALLRVNENGAGYHIKAGQAWVADL